QERPAGEPVWRAVSFAAWSVVLLSFGSPLFGNPFLFDARPEILGVLPVTVGLLRVVSRERFDGVAVALIVSSLLAREELALVAASALVLAPVPRTSPWPLPRRAWLAAACLAYFAIDSLISAGARSESGYAHFASAPGSGLELAEQKAALILVGLASAGGLAVLGYRWAGAALPGALLLLASRWMVGSQLSFHYSLFMAPGVLAAAYAGYRRVQRSVWSAAMRRWLTLLHVALALGSGVVASAWPQGALFARDHFDVHGSVWRPATWSTHTAWIADAHRTLASIPASHALLLPYVFAAPVADRASIHLLEIEGKRGSDGTRALPEVDTVVLLRSDWPRRGRALRESRGFRLWDLSRTNLAVLSRRPRARKLEEILPIARCDGASLSWPAAGLELCNIWRTVDGKVEAVVRRRAEHAAPGSPRLSLRSQSDGRVLELSPMDGLLDWTELPEGRPVVATTAGAVRDGNVRVFVTDASGTPISAHVGDAVRNDVALRLSTDRSAQE
ncbi:MAG TPA: DUF2079 domain-containing protein, partial [Polyangiales bacterium]|nr:DUF2079 domain-containing protein [Polyangiales bacterium]